MLQGFRLFQQCLNLPAGHCVAVCFRSVGTYLPGTVLQGYRLISGVETYLPGTVLQWKGLFKRCQNLPAGLCVTMVQTVKAMSEPTCQALCYSGADCLSNVRTYLPGTMLQWCRLFKQCQNIPARHCVTVMQTV